jgi:heme/copper-type cytochrome/quinol oxidase subunit 2
VGRKPASGFALCPGGYAVLVQPETARTTAPRARRRLEKAWLVFPAVIVLVLAIVFVVGFVL